MSTYEGEHMIFGFLSHVPGYLNVLIFLCLATASSMGLRCSVVFLSNFLPGYFWTYVLVGFRKQTCILRFELCCHGVQREGALGQFMCSVVCYILTGVWNGSSQSCVGRLWTRISRNATEFLSFWFWVSMTAVDQSLISRAPVQLSWLTLITYLWSVRGCMPRASWFTIFPAFLLVYYILIFTLIS
jgi:hypothetical protein